MNIRFTDDMSPARAGQVVDVLRSPRLWVPTDADYGDEHRLWLERLEQQLKDGSRHAIHAQVGRRSVGAVVFRRDTVVPNIVDIRNISINPEVKGRYFGAFMLRQAEHLAKEYYPDTDMLRVDTKATNDDMLAFLERQGYQQQTITDLYDSGKPDVVITKSIAPRL